MLTIDKLRVGVAGISISTLRRGNPPIDRMAQQTALSQTTMQETPQNDSFPTALSFNGVSDKLDMPYASELNPTSFTVEMWVMVGGGTGYQSIVASVGGSPLEGRKGYLFCVTPSQQWQFWLGNGEPRAFWRVLTGPKVRPGEWAHLAGTYDRNEETMTFYVNGQEVGRQIDVQYYPNDRNPMRVGAGATEQLGASPCFFCGKITEVHIWDRVLSITEIEALSVQQSIEIQAEPISEIDSPESASVKQDIHGTVRPLPSKDTPAPDLSKPGTGTVPSVTPTPSNLNKNTVTPDSSKPGTGTVPTVTPTPSKPSIEKPITPPVVEQPLALKQPSTVTSMSDPPLLLWQIGRPGQGGIPIPTGAWTQVYNYIISTDPDPVNRPVIPSCLVPPSASKIPNSTSQLNIHFVLLDNYTEGQLVLCYDRYGSGEDNIFLDGQLIAKTPGADKVQLKQTQIPLGVVLKGLHTLSITVSNSADSAHVIDYLQLQTSKPMLSNLTSQLSPSGNQPRRGNRPASQNAQAQGGQGGGLLGGLVSPVTGIVGQVAGAAGNPAELVGGLVGQVAGAAGNPAELVGGLVGQVAGAAGNPAELVGGLVGQVAGAAGNPAELVGGLVGQVAGAAGNPAELVGGLVGQVAGAAGNPAGLVGGLVGQVAGAAGNPAGLVGGLAGQVAGAAELVGGLAGQVAGAAGNPAGLVGGLVGQVAGAAGNPAGLVGGLAGQVAGAAGNPAGLVGGLAGQVAGAAGNPAELVGGLAGQVAGAAGNPAELVGGLVGQVAGAAGNPAGLVGGLVGQVAGAAGNPAGLVGGLAGQVAGLAGGLPGQSAAGSGNHPAVATALSVEVVVQLAGLVNQLSALIAQLGQMLNQLGIVNQSAARGMLPPQQLAHLSPQQLAHLSPQQLAQVYAAAQQVPGTTPQVASPMPALSPQQLAQLHEAARQILGIVPQVPSPMAGLSPQQLAQVYAAAQQAPGMASQVPPGMAALPPELLAQLVYGLQR
ncbi:hypothetical protein PI95_017605 [Hassallia byssoidea VB512170]|uniref:LamG-like jellyroll fold domain-containing protein n=1 Tax=Hassallia byssoidea VB512170 TaxID=1304833 RepID=A0A846HAE9_9CYAN|nr:LamG-like jellyroll fold domain-containing protein [Hassalia byssoidea]NEU74326.1 hypothetical protein [Hassalia byssoidea VB512170]